MHRVFSVLMMALALAFAGPSSSAQQWGFGETPAPQSDAKEWFYAVGEAVQGPVTLGELRALPTGTIAAETQVYVERNGWRPAKDHPELSDLYATTPAPAPQPATGPAPPPPPPPASAQPGQAELNAQMLSYLQGTWQSEGTTTVNSVTYRVVSLVNYGPNNYLSGTITSYEMSGAHFLTLAMEGTYQVQAMNADTMIVSGSWHYNTPTGGRTANDTNTSTVKIVDANTLQDVRSGNLSKRVK